MKGFLENESKFRRLGFRRTGEACTLWQKSNLPEGLEVSPDGLWCSNGGPERGHPARALPFSFEADLSEIGGKPIRLEILGVFARFADSKTESAGTIGATVQISDDRDLVFRQDLIHGRHYGDASDLTPITRANGDGTSISSFGEIQIGETTYRLDRLSIDLPNISDPKKLAFRDLGSPASFAILDVLVEIERTVGCPFHSKSGLIPLREVGAIVRVGDRRRFSMTLEQLKNGILATDDLDEARGQALTFLAVVTAGMLELGGSRDLHRIQLQAARTFDKLSEQESIAEEAIRLSEQITDSLFNTPESPSGYLMDKAMAIVERNFAKNLTDLVIAQQLGLSTSHFRFLFRQATGNPFHKYLIAVRLEKAKQMLLEQDLPVSQVAHAVGFTGLSHFSRAFTQRFAVSPSNVRKQPV